MKRLRNLGIVCGLGMALSGCNQSPTSMNAGGHTLGSGNAKEASFSTGGSSGGLTLGSGNRMLTGAAQDTTGVDAITSSGAATADSASVVERGGYTIGSGN